MKKIDEIYGKVKSGSSFENLAKEFSDDRNSARKGGELDWIESSGNYYKEFENAVFSLKENNQLSEPFLTPAGWHFIKRLDYIPLGDFKSLKSELKNKIKNGVIKNDIISGIGIKNLKERLEILSPEKYSMKYKCTDKFYIAKLSFNLK